MKHYTWVSEKTVTAAVWKDNKNKNDHKNLTTIKIINKLMTVFKNYDQDTCDRLFILFTMFTSCRAYTIYCTYDVYFVK